MSDPLAPQIPSPAPVAPESGGGFFQNLIDVYFSPRDAFTRILKRPSFWVPALLYFVVTLVGTAVWMRNVDPAEFTKVQMEEFGGRRVEQMPAEARQQAIDAQVRFFAPSRWGRTIVGTPVGLLITAAVLLFVFRFFYAGDTTLRQALTIVAWSLLAVELLMTPLRLLIMRLKGDWNIEPQLAIQASPGAFVDPSTPKWIWGLLSIPDVFSLWLVFLLATGFAVASRRSTASALWGVAIPWLLLALVGVGVMALFM